MEIKFSSKKPIKSVVSWPLEEKKRSPRFLREWQLQHPWAPNDSKPVKARQRRAHTRSRMGCIECKARRVKCDENRPIWWADNRLFVQMLITYAQPKLYQDQQGLWISTRSSSSKRKKSAGESWGCTAMGTCPMGRFNLFETTRGAQYAEFDSPTHCSGF